MTNKEVHEFGSIEDDETGVAALLSRLKRVEAPGDFVFRVNAGIASGSDSSVRSGSGILAVLRFAVPLALLLGVAGVLYINFNRPEPVERNGVAKLDVPAPSPDEVSPSVENDGASNLIVATGDTHAVGANTASANDKVVKEAVITGPAANSYDQAGTKPRTVVPRGTSPDQVGTRTVGGQDASLSVDDVLQQIGVDTIDGASGRRVLRVREHSLAARAGLKADDVIEGVNNQKITSMNRLSAVFEGKSLIVRRGGRVMTIGLKP